MSRRHRSGWEGPAQKASRFELSFLRNPALATQLSPYGGNIVLIRVGGMQK